jgi:hypothetical protein
VASNLLVPLSMEDIYSELVYEGLGPGTTSWVLSLFGVELENYGDDDPLN